ncbi:hypothetical protein EHS25_006652 [Saitozyma podzolica]|uniref:MHD domain-containing protein n=1 Tax=Saitozyma podzolica TaxID=1890683 RepID=A0A427YSE8_9TREE|nr:hypothetical protein EHS25_006652 [Saitozyma podzolica]
MTRIDGIIILDTNGKPIITSNFPSHPPSYSAIHIDAFNHALKLRPDSGAGAALPGGYAGVEPVIWVNTLSRTAGESVGMGVGMGGAGLCHLEREGLRFLVPISHEVNPLFAFSFLESFLETLQDYLGEITEATLKDNFAIVYMLIEEMLDEGHPMTMETNMLKEIVLPPTLMRKILNAAGVSGLQAPTTAPFTAPIPWRRPGVRHSNNEIYFDIEETLDAIMDRRGVVLSSQLWGRINCNSRLSGNPDLLLSFTNGKLMENCSFHPCIRYSKWEKDGVLSFIPPDGRFRLLEYQVAGSSQVPISLRPRVKVEDYGGKFSLTLASRSSRPLEDITVTICLGAGATSVSATATGDKRPLGVAPAGLAPGGRKDEAAALGNILRWTISSLLSTERPPTLTGSWTSTEREPVPDPAFNLGFALQHQAFSSLRVDQLRVRGDVQYKPFKGVRVVGRGGRVEVRW